jgi:hypothetical protein
MQDRRQGQANNASQKLGGAAPFPGTALFSKIKKNNFNSCLAPSAIVLGLSLISECSELFYYGVK